MGAHESEPSGKRFRRGSAIKYRHKNFRLESTPQVLNKIKRKTCPTDEMLALTKSTKESRQTESDLGLQYKRFMDILQALKSEIDDREKEVKRRKLEENSAVQSDLSNDNWDNNEDCDYLIGQSSSFYQQPPASSSSGIKDTSLPTTAVNSMLQAANPVHFDETIQFLQSTAGDELKATEFSYTYDANCNNWTENDDEQQQQYMFDFLTSL